MSDVFTRLTERARGASPGISLRRAARFEASGADPDAGGGPTPGGPWHEEPAGASAFDEPPASSQAAAEPVRPVAHPARRVASPGSGEAHDNAALSTAPPSAPLSSPALPRPDASTGPRSTRARSRSRRDSSASRSESPDAPNAGRSASAPVGAEASAPTPVTPPLSAQAPKPEQSAPATPRLVAPSRIRARTAADPPRPAEATLPPHRPPSDQPEPHDLVADRVVHALTHAGVVGESEAARLVVVRRGESTPRSAGRRTTVRLDAPDLPAGREVHVHIDRVEVVRPAPPAAPPPTPAAAPGTPRVDHGAYLERQARRSQRP